MFKEKGVTLLEMLVVVGIIAVFSVIAVFNFGEARGQMALTRAAHQLIQDLRRAKEMAMSSAQIEGCPSPIKGYGIYIKIAQSTTSYKLYADTATDNSEDCETLPQPCYGYYNSLFTPSDYVVETIQIQEKGVIISDINNSNKKISINFKPPNPDIKIKWLEGDEVEITLALKSNPSKTKTVVVNEIGVFQIR